MEASVHDAKSDINRWSRVLWTHGLPDEDTRPTRCNLEMGGVSGIGGVVACSGG